MREIRTLRATWRGLETWNVRDMRAADRRASPRPYLCSVSGLRGWRYRAAPAWRSSIHWARARPCHLKQLRLRHESKRPVFGGLRTSLALSGAVYVFAPNKVTYLNVPLRCFLKAISSRGLGLLEIIEATSQGTQADNERLEPATSAAVSIPDTGGSMQPATLSAAP
jgi:hypothetical protein